MQGRPPRGAQGCPFTTPNRGKRAFFPGVLGAAPSTTINQPNQSLGLLAHLRFGSTGWGGCQGGLTTEPEDMVGGTIPYRDWHPFEVIGPDHGADIKTKSPITVPKVCGSMD